MNIIRTIIADDEPLARGLLASYLAKLPRYQLVASCANALEVLDVLNNNGADLLLLDINMPEISGIDLLKSLVHPPGVIFTTAYAQHAVASYELNAIDYLLKPVTFSRFLQALQKVEQQTTAARPATGNDVLFVRSEGKMLRIIPDELLLVEGYGNYIRLWTPGEKIIVHGTMKAAEEQFRIYPAFVRISKSYIVHLKAVTELDGNCVFVGGQALAIGAAYRDSFRTLMDHHRLL